MQYYTPGTCDKCGHDRSKTKPRNGQTVCILCEAAVSEVTR